MTRPSRVRASDGLLDALREQLRDTTTDVLSAALEARLVRNRQRDPLERTREILERDRALCAAEPRQAPRLPKGVLAGVGPPAAPSSPRADTEGLVCREPIRTRTMAKLLASQGETERALGIYAYLVAQEGADEALLSEMAALRAVGARDAGPCPQP